MKTTLEPEDIKAIAEKMVEIMLPLLNQRQEQQDTILSIDEASSLFGKSKGQIYRWVSDSRHGLNTFPYMKAGKTLRFSQKKFIEWMFKNGNND
jgi:predicted DNA-binding transcriptional regulator AlpA